MEIVRKKLDPAEVSSPLVRYDADCACIQTTSDGTTWVNTPARDMRSSPSFALPPVAGGNPPCDAAASVIENFRTGLSGLIVQIDEGVSIFGAASWIITLLDFLDGIGVFIQLFVDLVTLIIGIGTTGVSAAFTDAVYQQLECILSCAFASDGTMTPDKFTEAQAQITTAFGALSDVNLVFQGWLAPLGNVGLQNIAALKHVTGDCSSCDPCTWSKTFDFTIDAHTFTPGAGCAGTYVPGTGWPNNGADCGGYYRANASIAFVLPEGCTVEHVECAFTGFQTYGRVVGIQPHSGGTFYGYSDFSNTPGVSPLTADISVIGDGATLWDFLFVLDNPTSNTFTVVSVEINGTGIEPSFPT